MNDVSVLDKTGTALGLTVHDSKLRSVWVRPSGEVYAQTLLMGDETTNADSAPLPLGAMEVSNRTLLVDGVAGSDAPGIGLRIRQVP